MGSNLGDRERMLQAALDELNAPDLQITRVSPIYETEPQDNRDQPWFLNLVAEASAALFPMQLLARTSKIERKLGRRRLTPKGPRTIDIDILFYGRAIVKTATLEIPHPRYSERRFVLEPMAVLAPDFRDPVTHKTIREQLAAVASQKLCAHRLRSTPSFLNSSA